MRMPRTPSTRMQLLHATSTCNFNRSFVTEKGTRYVLFVNNNLKLVIQKGIGDIEEDESIIKKMTMPINAATAKTYIFGRPFS